MMKLVGVIVASVIVATGSAGLEAGSEQQGLTSTREIMQEKLDHAKELLAALALRDYSAVAEHAEKLHDLSKVQSWYVLPTPEYTRHSEEFRAAATDAVSAGRDRDADATVGAYSALVRKCVQCHDYMAGVRDGNR